MAHDEPTFEIVIRCLAEDEPFAKRLAEALRMFGYAADWDAGGPPAHFTSREAFDRHCRVAIFLWSATSIERDEFLWEAADANGLFEYREDAPVRVCGVEIERLGARIELAAYSKPQPINLHAWSGDAADEVLGPLLFRIGPPRQPGMTSPQPMPVSEWEARLRAAIAAKDIRAVARVAGFMCGQNYSNSWLKDAERWAPLIDQVRVALQDSRFWARFGHEASRAAVQISRDGGAALYALGLRWREAGCVEDEVVGDILGGWELGDLLAMIQIVAVDCEPLLSRFHDPRRRTDLERAVAKGSADAMVLLANAIVRSPEERDHGLALLKQAAELENPEACWLLSVFVKEHADYWLRRGQALGHPHCVEQLLKEEKITPAETVTFYKQHPSKTTTETG